MISKEDNKRLTSFFLDLLISKNMSYIDTIEHELVGNLNGLPIYHPLETIDNGKWGNYDFSCSPKNLVIGGGSGEHPGLIIHGLDSLVINYLLEAFDNCKEHWPDFKPPPDKTIETLTEFQFDFEGEHLEFCGWSMKNFKDFIDLAKSPLHGNPLKNENNAEEWIKYSLGEFIYYSIPELNPLNKEISNLPGMKDLFIGYWMRNVTCPPPNYVKSKAESLKGVSFKRHGFFRWDFILPEKE